MLAAKMVSTPAETEVGAHRAGDLLVHGPGTGVETGSIRQGKALHAVVRAAWTELLAGVAGHERCRVVGGGRLEDAVPVVARAEGGVGAVGVDPGREPRWFVLPARQGIDRYPAAIFLRESLAGGEIGDRWVVVRRR